jgi:hypothetical protein
MWLYRVIKKEMSKRTNTRKKLSMLVKKKQACLTTHFFEHSYLLLTSHKLTQYRGIHEL